MKNNTFKLTAIVLLGALLSACSGQDIPEDADSPENAFGVSLTRVYQRIIRYDCDNNVTSDRIEEIDGPDKMMEIKPVTGSEASIDDPDFYNVTTGDGPGVIIDNTKFAIDYDGLWSRMEVTDGINRIDYKFRYYNGDVEEGSRYINVSYSEYVKDGYQEYRPHESECTEPE